LVQRPEATILAEQRRLGFALHRQLFKENVHGDLENGVHHGEQPHQEQIGIRFQPGGEQFAKTGASQSHQYQFAAFLLGRAHGDDEPHPTPHFPFSQNGHGMSNRLDFERKSKDRGIQIPEQAVRNRGFLLEQFLEFTHVDFLTADHF